MTIHAPNFHASVILHRKLSSKNNLGGNPIRAPDTRTPSTDATEQVHKQANRLYSKKPHKLWRYTTLKLATLISYDSNKPLNYLQATLKKITISFSCHVPFDNLIEINRISCTNKVTLSITRSQNSFTYTQTPTNILLQ